MLVWKIPAGRLRTISTFSQIIYLLPIVSLPPWAWQTIPGLSFRTPTCSWNVVIDRFFLPAYVCNRCNPIRNAILTKARRSPISLSHRCRCKTPMTSGKETTNWPSLANVPGPADGGNTINDVKHEEMPMNKRYASRRLDRHYTAAHGPVGIHERWILAHSDVTVKWGLI